MLTLQFKQALHAHCLELLCAKCLLVEENLSALKQDLLSESKSTAGDKHETGRAMLQLEMEKLGSQLATLQKSKTLLERINPSRSSKTLQTGCLAQINNKWYYLSIGLGEVKFEAHTIFCLAPTSPLAQAFLGAPVGTFKNFRGSKLLLQALI